MSKLSKKMQELKRVIRLHANWLVYATLGESALSKSEIEELEKYGKLPMDKTLDLADKSYLLGRLRAILKRSEYKDISYEEAEEKLGGMKLSPIEELVLEQARLKAGQALKGLAQEISDGVYSALAQSLGTAVTEASIQQIVADETELALIYKKTAQELASSLAARLQTSAKRDWKMVAQTELQRAKVAGQAQAIVNKIDIYAHSDGPDSKVSVIPAASCCEDCREHYLDASGNPKIFTLSDLMSAGSNADPGVIHKKKQGVHTHWKTTLPPLHPNCGCNLIYVPSGYGWTAGKLGLLNKSLFDMTLRKANSTAGVSGGISPTVTPKGPPQPKSATASAGTPSVAGAAAPGNVAGPGKPPGSGGGTAPSGGSTQQMSPCPFGGGAECQKHGGPQGGSETHKANGSVMKKHQEAMARGAQPTTELAKEQQKQQFETQSKVFNTQGHPDAKVLSHLSEGEIGAVERRGGTQKGINDSYTVHIVGNGSGLMKPPVDYTGYISKRKAEGKSSDELEKMANELGVPGNGTIPKGMNPRCEAGAYQRASSLGVKLVPATTTRLHDGAQDGPVGYTSVQHFRENAVSTRNYVTEDVDAPGADRYNAILRSVPAEHKDKVKEQFATVAVMDVLWNNNDRHFGNLMMDSQNHDVIAIDHGTAFGNGLSGHRNEVAFEMHKSGVPIQLPPHLHEKLKNETLESTQRAMPSIPAWSQGQTYLRQKYVLDLHEQHGHIPFEKIRGTAPNALGEVGAYSHQWITDEDPTGFKTFYKAEENNELPHQQFESWAKNWMETASSDPSHPDHEDAKRLMDIQPLRASAHITGKEPTSKDSLQSHFDRIPPYKPSDVKSTKVEPKETPPPIRTPPKVSGLDSTVPQVPQDKTPARGPRAMRMQKSLVLQLPHTQFPLDNWTER